MKNILVLSDIQADFEDAKAVAAVTKFCAEYKPDMVACVGDELDSTAISRWVKGTKDEFAGNLQQQVDRTQSIMRGFREAAGDVPFVVQRSNHTTTRLETYVTRYAPGLASLRVLDYKNLMAYDDMDIELSMKPYPVAPGWLMLHGDELSSSIRSAGGTALSLARKTGKSVVCGHTHKLGLQHEHAAFNGSIRTHLYGMEVGNLMDMKKASYLGIQGANWNQGFGILTVSNGKVHPHLVPILNKQFIVDGVEYSW